MKIFRRKGGVRGRPVNPAARAPSEFEVKLRERLNAMPRARQYRLVKIGMLTLAAFVALRVAVTVYRMLK